MTSKGNSQSFEDTARRHTQSIQTLVGHCTTLVVGAVHVQEVGLVRGSVAIGPLARTRRLRTRCLLNRKGAAPIWGVRPCECLGTTTGVRPNVRVAGQELQGSLVKPVHHHGGLCAAHGLVHRRALSVLVDTAPVKVPRLRVPALTCGGVVALIANVQPVGGGGLGDVATRILLPLDSSLPQQQRRDNDQEQPMAVYPVLHAKFHDQVEVLIWILPIFGLCSKRREK